MESTMTSEMKVSGADTERTEPAGFTRTRESSHRIKRYRTRSSFFHSEPGEKHPNQNTLMQGEPGFSQQQDKILMDPVRPGSLYLRSTSAVSLNERFSQVLKTQLTRPNRTMIRTSEPVLLQPRRRRKRAVLVLAQAPPICMRRRRRSVWTRLGGLRLSRHLWSGRPPGFWSFRNKYTWRAWSSAPYRRRRNTNHVPGQRHLVGSSDLQTSTAGGGALSCTLQRGGATTFKGRGFPSKDVLTKKQLDAQLDEYMSLSRSRLDQQLDDYMSMSRRRLDEELDDYMLMAGQTLED